jgi:hypothetical protein
MKYNDIEGQGWRDTGLVSLPALSLRKNHLKLGIVNMDYYADLQRVLSRDNQLYFNNPTVANTDSYNRYYGEASLYRSFRLPFMQVTPSAKLYYTRWDKAKFDVDNITEQQISSFTHLLRAGNGYERIVPEFSIKANLNQLYKYYGENRHSIMNTFEYVFIEEVNQAGLPDHFVTDRLDNKSEINWQIRSYYATKNWRVQFGAKQGINLKSLDDRPFSPLEITALLAKSKVFSNSLKMELDLHGGTEQYGTVAYLSNSLSIPIDVFTIRGGYIYDGLLQTNNTDVSAGISANIKDKLLLSATANWIGHNKLLSVERLISRTNTLSARWQTQCWTAGVLYQWERRMDNTYRQRGEVREITVGLTLELRGLGDSRFEVHNSIDPYE